MLYTDGLHLISDTGIEHLHQYAQTVGIDRNAFKITGTIASHPHYKIYGNVRHRVMADNQVVKTTARHLVKLLQLNYNLPRNEEEVIEWEAKHGKLLDSAVSDEHSKAIIYKTLSSIFGIHHWFN